MKETQDSLTLTDREIINAKCHTSYGPETAITYGVTAMDRDIADAATRKAILEEGSPYRVLDDLIVGGTGPSIEADAPVYSRITLGQIRQARAAVAWAMKERER